MNQEKLLFFIIAGEESGDIHGANLVKAMKKKCPSCMFIGHGGNKMASSGVKILEHISSLSMVGFSEIIKHLPYMIRVMRQTIKKIKETNPSRVILIDYPGFNLRITKKIFSHNIPITYFILPQTWAWKEKRIKIIRNYVNQSLSIFPFEYLWFKSRGIETKYLGHPFSDWNPPKISRKDFFNKHNLSSNNSLLVLMPGSRQQEIDKHWNILLKTTKILKSFLPDLQIVVVKAPAITLPTIPENFRIEYDSKRALHYGSAAIIASGTATLEAALSNIPFVVCYRMSSITWGLLKMFTNVPYASMVNLIGNKKIVDEFLQKKMNAKNLSRALLPLLNDSTKREAMYLDFIKIKKMLGKPGVYDRLAREILEKNKL